MPLIGDDERAAVDRVLRSGMLAQGPEVAAFEEEFSQHVDGRHCVAVNSGTSALHLGLLAVGIGPGDEVIVPSFTFAATGNVVRLVGATPAFADIDPHSYCLSVDAVAAAMTDRTVAILPVHLYGHPADLVGLRALARRHGCALIEDAAQAHLAVLDGRPAGAWGEVAAFSFYPTKNMTTGEGGIVVTSDAEVARKVRLLRNQGMERRYHNEVVGFNLRMTDLAAAIGRVQLRRLEGWTAQRRTNAARLDEGLTGLRGISVPSVAPGVEHAYHQYTVRVAKYLGRDEVQQRLAGFGVGSGVYYPVPTHRLASFDLDLDLPETARAAAEVLSLPVHPGLTDDDVAAVIDGMTQAVRS